MRGPGECDVTIALYERPPGMSQHKIQMKPRVGFCVFPNVCCQRGVTAGEAEGWIEAGWVFQERVIKQQCD